MTDGDEKVWQTFYDKQGYWIKSCLVSLFFIHRTTILSIKSMNKMTLCYDTFMNSSTCNKIEMNEKRLYPLNRITVK